MSAQAQQSEPDPRGKCDHICLRDGEHVERGEPHFYGYEHPSPRDRAERAEAENRELREKVEHWMQLFERSAEDARERWVRLAEAERHIEALLHSTSVRLDNEPGIAIRQRAVEWLARSSEGNTDA